jgi:nucleoside-diphosphate-sugar epimerase
MLEAAAKELSVKSLVYTRSQAVCVNHEPGKEYRIDSSKWNEDSKAAWTLPQTTDFPRMYLNYACAKTEAEQVFWKRVKEHKPNFKFNTVLLNLVLGRLASPEHTRFPSSLGSLKLTWEGNPLGAALIPPQWYVDSADVGLLHLVSLTFGSKVKGFRGSRPGTAGMKYSIFSRKSIPSANSWTTWTR